MKRKMVSAAVAAAAAAMSGVAQAQVLEEIVVTAQKREQSMDDIGVAVTAFTGDDIQRLGVKQPIDLAGQTPGLSIGNALGSSNPAITVRGVGINDFNVNTNPGVAVYVDEIYQPIPASLSFGLFDIERVEVLKGPQGTLYGRNATGGAVSFVTNKPTEELDGYITAEFGDFDHKNVEAALGGPLGENVRARVSGFWTDRGEGFQNVVDPGTGNIIGDHGKIERSAVRAQLGADFGDNIDVLLAYTYGIDKSDSDLATITDSETIVPLCQYYGYLTTLQCNQFYYYTTFGGPAGGYNNVLLTDPSNPPVVDIESSAFNLTANFDFGASTLTSVTGLIDVDHSVENDFASVENIAQDIIYGGDMEQFSQEFRLTSNESELVDWIVGLYYSKTEQDNVSAIRQDVGIGFVTYLFGLSNFGDPIGAATTATQEQTSTGVFAHTEWNLSDRVRLTAAGRYSQDELSYDAAVLDISTGSVPGIQYPEMELFNILLPAEVRTGGVIAANSDRDNKENSFTWKVGLDYSFSDDVLLYGHASTGFKNHGFYGGLGPLSSQYTAYKPEEITAFEIGLKAGFADGAAQWNTAVFQYVLDDPQVIVSEDIGIGSPNDVLWNIKEAKGTGIETELTWLPSENLLLKLGASWLDAEVSDVTVTGKTLFAPLTEGAQTAYAPDLTVNGLVKLDISLGSGGIDSYVQVDFDYRDKALSFAGRPDTETTDRTLINARFAVVGADGRWEAALWGRNLTDEKWAGYAYQILGPMQMHQAPRTYGISLSYSL